MRLLFLGLSVFFFLASCTKDRIYVPPEISNPTSTPSKDSAILSLNEIMASSAGSFPDPVDGASDDWFEIYNHGKASLNLSGWAFSDDPANPLMCVLPENAAELTIPPGGYMVFWADDTPNQGARHLAFKLSSTNGDKVFMSNASGVLIDSVSFGPQNQEVSYGRLPDGVGTWRPLNQPSPGSKNQ